MLRASGWESSLPLASTSLHLTPPGRQTELAEWLRLLRASGHVLRERPHLLVQQAGNAVEGSAVSHAAAAELARRPRAWLRWINRPRRPSACVLVFTGHRRAVTGCALSAAQPWLFSVSHDGTVRSWSVATGEELARRDLGERLTACSLSAGGARLLVGSGGNKAYGRGRLWLLDAATLATLLEIDTEGGEVANCAMAPDGSWLLSATRTSATVWEVDSGRRRTVISGAQCVISHDGRVFYGCDSELRLRAWSTADGKPVGTLGQLPGGPSCLQATPDGRWILAAQTGLEEPSRRFRARALPRLRLSRGQAISSLLGHYTVAFACAPNGDLAAAGGAAGRVRLWHPGTDEFVATLGGHGTVRALSFSADASWLASASDDGTLRLWDCAAAVDSQPSDDVDQVAFASAFSPDGRHLLIARRSGVLQVLDGTTGDPVARAEHSFPWTHCGYLTGGRLFARDFPGTSHLFDGTTLAAVSASDELAGDLEPMHSGKAAQSAMAWGALRLGSGPTAISTPGGRQLRCAELAQCGAAISTPGGRLAWPVVEVVGEFMQVGYIYGVVRLCTWPQRELVTEIKAHDDEVVVCAFSGDGARLLTASKDGRVRLWDADSGRPVATLCIDWESGTPVLSLAGDRVALGTDTCRRVAVFAVAGGAPLAAFASPRGRFRTAALSPTARFLAAGDDEGLLRVFAVDTGEEVAAFVVGSEVVEVAWHPAESRLAVQQTGGGALLLSWERPQGVSDVPAHYGLRSHGG